MVAVPKYLQPSHHSQPLKQPPADFVLADTLEGLQAQASALAEEISAINRSLIGENRYKDKATRRQALMDAQEVVWDAIRKAKARLDVAAERTRLQQRIANGLPLAHWDQVQH